MILKELFIFILFLIYYSVVPLFFVFFCFLFISNLNVNSKTQDAWLNRMKEHYLIGFQRLQSTEIGTVQYRDWTLKLKTPCFRPK